MKNDANGYLQDLINAGLTENEAKVYHCLLMKQHFTATEISRCTNVNRSKIYSVLENLNKMGLCIEKLGKVRKFEAVNPDVAFTKLIEEQKDALDRLLQLPKLLSPLYNKQKNNSYPLDFIQVFSTPASIIKKHHTLELESRECVLSFCKPPYAMSRELDIHEEQWQSMKTGVTYKSIFEVERDDPLFFAQRMKNFELQGEEIKVADHLPIKLHVFDDHTVMFSMINKLSPEENLTYLVIEHSDLAESLISTFYLYWEKALRVDDFLDRENIDLSDFIREHDIKQE
ncbi:MAG: TrmB family transcriptional regulator [Candidatus Cloacimonetes bacterium]|nr:TrmB family transcriptional regulator [Candidatus Cloacimonadota bacterium]